MRILLPKIVLCLSVAVASIAHAAVPSMNVIVSDSAGNAAFKGATKSDGAFATSALKPGSYVIQFTTKNAAVKGGQYSIVVAAGKKKVVANAVAGDKFLAGGVAMKVEVAGGSSITGQVWAGATADATTSSRDSARKMQDRSQDSHQEGFHPSMSNVQDKMTNR
jgi:anti-sigma factor RsiW